MTDVRVALLGAGPWGRNIAATVSNLDGARIVAIASRNPAARDLVPGAAIDPDWRAVIARSDVDAVVVALPPAFHAAATAAAAARKRPVLVEKPLTLDPDEARALAAAAARADVLVMVDHLHLFHPAFRALKGRARDLGGIRRIEAVAGAFGPFRDGVPVLWDWGAHDVAMCLDLIGTCPASVRATRKERRLTADGVGEMISLDLEFPDGVPAALTLGNLFDAKVRRFAVDCDGGRLVYEDFVVAPLTLAPPCGDPVVVPVGAEPPLTCVLREFVSAVRAGSRDRSDLDLGVRVVETLARGAAALRESAAGN